MLRIEVKYIQLIMFKSSSCDQSCRRRGGVWGEGLVATPSCRNESGFHSLFFPILMPVCFPIQGSAVDDAKASFNPADVRLAEGVPSTPRAS